MTSPETSDVSPTLITRKTDNPVMRSNATNKQDIVPRYLRASTGSCHDACKHGKSHEFKDTKPWKPKRRVSAPPLNDKNIVDIQIFVDKKVKNAVKPDEVKRSLANEKIKKDLALFKRTPLVDSSKNIKQEDRFSTNWSSYKAPKMVKKVVPSAETLKTPRESDLNKNSKEVRSYIKSSSNEAPKMVKKVVQSEQNKSTPRQEATSARKRDDLAKRASSNAKEWNASVRPLKQDVTPMKSSSSPNPTKYGEERINEPKIANPKVSRLAAKKMPTLSTVTSSTRRTSRVATDPSPNLNTRKIKSSDDNSQISQVLIETGEDILLGKLNGTQLIKSLPPLPSESPNSSIQTYPTSFTSHEIDSECDDSASSSDASGKMEGPTHGEDPKSLNMKFKRGRIIEPKSESNRETKVKFKQGRTLETKPEVNAGSRRKSYRKRGAENHKRESEADPVKVALRHQDVEVKKEEVLLNNVIEQTANKLVEARKSKVKALVGAFETVISLQERKSSTADR